MSTFGGLNTAFTGLNAARRGFEVTGQNVANASTPGYTRQRVQTSAAGPAAPTGPVSGVAGPGQGVTVDGIARLGSAQLDTRARHTAADAGYSAVRANTLAALETTLHEPGEHGLSARLQDFWAAWQEVSNSPGEAAPAAVLLETAGRLGAQLAGGYRAVEDLWSQVRADLGAMAEELNGTAAQVAELNGRIRSALAAGGAANELLDQRSVLTSAMAALAGGKVRDRGDGTVDVLVDGNVLVSGDSFRAVQVTGASRLGEAGDVVRLTFAQPPATPVTPDAGEIAGALSMLAAADGTGTGGALAEAAAFYDRFAAETAQAVNDLHRQGATPGGASGSSFFALDPARPALSLAVIPTAAAQIAAGAPGAGALSGEVADRISQLGDGEQSPDAAWSAFVVRTGVATRTELQRAELAGLAADSAAAAQLAHASVDLDEENVNLLAYQHAYQGAARVMTAIDEMLDILINRMGLVGR